MEVLQLTDGGSALDVPELPPERRQESGALIKSPPQTRCRLTVDEGKTLFLKKKFNLFDMNPGRFLFWQSVTLFEASAPPPLQSPYQT